MTDARYLRTRGGKKIHRAGCIWLSIAGKAANATRWDWADGMTFHELVSSEAPRTTGETALCGHCFDMQEQVRWMLAYRQKR